VGSATTLPGCGSTSLLGGTAVGGDVEVYTGGTARTGATPGGSAWAIPPALPPTTGAGGR
jgi:hypothetical protein